ncbi:MAG: preprotein translocase subunit SecY [Defluviitaleaceae bacterium]|nr:preprotein translocase subunit SecY [Defluviitaleaceae bacterium]
METLKKTFQNADLRKRILFTVIIFIIYRIGTFITVPGVNAERLYALTDTPMLGFMDALSGGALGQFSIFAMSISPYITASIVVQLLQMDVIPILSEWAKEGETGKRKLNQLTRYMSLILAFIQAIVVAIGFNFTLGGVLLQTQAWWIYLYIGLIMTAGTAILLFLADQITVKGIGNGTSMLIIAGIMSRMPGMIRDIYVRYLTEITVFNMIGLISVVALMLITIVAVIYLQSATRKLPIQYANRHNSAQLSGQKDSFIPFKLNSAGVIPVIFASSLISLPLTIAQFMEGTETARILSLIFNFQEHIIGLILYIVLIGAFTFFYAFVQVSPEKIAENLKKQGSYIPGIRPGDDTENYVSKILGRVTFIGAIYLIAIATLPIFLGFIPNLDIPQSVQIGGTGILIVVGVALETAKQISNKNQEKEYRGFIK